MKKLPETLLAVFVLCFLCGCENTLVGNLNMAGSSVNNSKDVKKPDGKSPQTEAAPVPPAPPKIVYVFDYTHEGKRIDMGRVIAINPPEKDFPEGSVTIEINQPGMPEPVQGKIDPRYWKIIKPTSPIKIEEKKAEFVDPQ